MRVDVRFIRKMFYVVNEFDIASMGSLFFIKDNRLSMLANV